MSYEILNKINSPEELKALDKEELIPLCNEIREFLVDKVTKTGGHLASNLGVVELSVALHRVFDSPRDKIIFDVGHQSYVHKILTGRKNGFDELRRPGGLSGFTSMKESEHDPFGAGHSSTSLSAALGYAEAEALNGSDNYTVCVVGDGAYTGGMIHEAINNCRPDLRLIVILNENGMSISSNKGRFASYLSSVRASKGYQGIKDKTRSFLSRIPILGRAVHWLLSGIKNLLKKVFFTPNYFEELGFLYLGPIDGNDYKKVEATLREAKKLGKCVFVHINTTKGKGSDEAEKSPDKFHSVYCQDKNGSTFHSVFAEELSSIASNDDNVVAITAAMGLGTGLQSFGEQFPSRYFDVGIAEEHALTFAAGLAAAGKRPYAAIYSTFIQRAYDNIIHDIALQGLPVRLMIDRAGLALGDGATHHGIFDVAFLSHIPQMEIYAPFNYECLRKAIHYSVDCKGPMAIRYSNCCESTRISEHTWHMLFDGAIMSDFELDNIPKRVFVSYGGQCDRLLEAKALLAEQGINVGVMAVQCIKPYKWQAEAIKQVLMSGAEVVYAEEGIKIGGSAMTALAMLVEDGVDCSRLRIAAIDDCFASPTEKCELYDFVGLSARKLAKYFE